MTRFFASVLRRLVWAFLPAAAFGQSDGSLHWSFFTSGAVFSSPALAADGTVYVGNQASVFSQSRLYAIRPDGTLRWEFTGASDWIDSAPAVGADGTVYAGSWDGKLYAIDPANGLKKWEFAALGFIASSPALASDGTIYFGSGDRFVYALNPDGSLKWSYAVADWVDSSPAVGPDGTVYFGSWDNQVYALHPDGTLRWQFATGGHVISSPAVGADGTVFIGSTDGWIYALDGLTGALHWSYATLGPVEASPVLGNGGVVYVGSSDGYLYALNSVDGTLVWQVHLGGEIHSSAALRADGTIILGADHYLYALNPDGTQKWRLQTGDFVDSSPVIAPSGTIYVGSSDRRLYAIHGNGQPASSTAWAMFRRNPQRRGRTDIEAVLASTVTLIAPSSPAMLGSSLTLQAFAFGDSLTYQWHREGVPIAGATAATLDFSGLQPSDAGLYSVTISTTEGTGSSASVLIAPELGSIRSAGSAELVGEDIEHENKNRYDQFLLTGTSASVNAADGRIARISYIDLSDDIVQVEFSGSGTLSILLDAASGPHPPEKYNQPDVSYMKGHARLYFTGADENSHLSVFSVGTHTAVNQSLFPPDTTYDGVADLAAVAIASPTGRFGGVRAGNLSLFTNLGIAGLHAPGIAFSGPVFLHDITAFAEAVPALLTGAVGTHEVWITGGDLDQPEGPAVQIGAAERIVMQAGTDSHGRLQPAQANRARIERGGVDVTGSVVIDPGS